MPAGLFDYANCGNFDDRLTTLKSIAINEYWGNSTNQNSILKNYILHYFDRVFECKLIEYTKDSDGKEFACFNTGLLTNHYDDIYAYFEVNESPRKKGVNQKWFLASFVNGSSHKLSKFKKLPDIVQFFNSIDDLYFDTKIELRINAEHIVKDNIERFPSDLVDHGETVLINLVEGAIKIAKKRIKRNYKTAVPQFFNNQIQFLIPLCLKDPSSPEIVLTVYKREDHYYGATCLTIEMAYNNARLLVKPESDWLKLT